jgi:hypothetical protein
VKASPLALAALVAVNLVPLIGVAFLGWRLYDVMLLYWLENGVIGAFTLARMVTAGSAPASTLFFGPFFVVHYGMFWTVHGIFVVALFGGHGPFAGGDGLAAAPLGPLAADPAFGTSLALPLVGRIPVVEGLGVALAGLVLSHGVSFVQNWLLGGERREASPASIMPRPYGRVVVLHVTLLVGGFTVQLLGAPLVALVLMVAMKVGLDAAAHLREHRAARTAPGPAPASVATR